ncbi:MAG: SGNH/GDSL hydrolase family protein [Pseudomonadota bacterium]
MENDATPPAYSALFVFGDSLSDNGAVFALSGGTVPPTTLTGTDTNGDAVDFDAAGIFFNQNFTNGSVYADVAADLLKIASDTSTFYDNLSGSNLAVGGATATDLTAFGDTTLSTLADQVAAFQGGLAALPGTAEEQQAFLSGAAASVFIGLNDLGPLGNASATLTGFDLATITAGIQTIVDEIDTQVQALAATGVGTIILNKLPSTAFFPSSNDSIDAFGPETVALFDQVSASINFGLDIIAGTVGASGTQVETVDFFSLAKEIEGDTETFGFQTLENALPSSDANTTLLIDDVPISEIGFIDPVHFTSELHEIFGVFQAMTLGTTQFNGTDDSNFIAGSSTADTIFALGGNDVVLAQDGNDLVFAGADSDGVFAGAGKDIAFGGTGGDAVLGQAGGDVLAGGGGSDFVDGGTGNDFVSGSAGQDYLRGGDDADVLVGGRDGDVLSAGLGDDFVIYLAPGTASSTGSQTDLIFGAAGTDTLLIVSDTAIDDTGAFLAANDVLTLSVEVVEVVTTAELEAYDFGIVGAQVDTADLFGLV